MKKIKLKKSSIYPLFLLLILGSCFHDDSQYADKNIFRYNEAANIVTLDPAFARDQAHLWVCNQLYNGLVQLDDELKVIPAIAKSWQISEDGLEYTFTLRDDVYFHDDESFNGHKRKVIADDFVYSFKRLLDPATASPGVWVFNAIKSDSNYQAIRALSDTVLMISLNKPFPPFLSILSMQYCSVIPFEAVHYYGQEWRKHPVGTGPFKIVNWEENIKLVLRRNDHYFEKDNSLSLPYLDGVAISFTADKMTAFMEFVQGKLDFISGIDASYKDEILSKDGQLRSKYKDKFVLSKLPYLNTEYLGILVDTSNPQEIKSPLKIKKIRQAINMGFDRNKMIHYLRNNIGVPGEKGIIPMGLPSFNTEASYGYTYNPIKARELIEEAGFGASNPVPAISLVTTAEYLDLCKFVQAQLLLIGLDLEIEVVPPAAAIEMRALSKVNFFRASWIADYPDEENYLSLFYSENFSPDGPNYTHFSHETFDHYYEKALLEEDPVIRRGMYASLDSIVMEESPVVILYYDQVLRFKQKYVKGLGNNAINLLNLKRVRFEKEGLN